MRYQRSFRYHFYILCFITFIFVFLYLQLSFLITFAGSNRREASTTRRLVWLLSFPNSGTSYTLQLVRRATRTLTASNYGNEVERALNVYDDDEQGGPFWSEARFHSEYAQPHRYILTKTHCGGHCMDCGPSTYAQTLESFHLDCASGKRKDENGILQAVRYNPRKVSKVIHLVRDPFNNIVSRFHHEWKQITTKKPTKDDFRRYCQKLNDKYPSKVQDLLHDVPCRDDFVRYAQWHNHAFRMEQIHRLPTLVVQYEDYEQKFSHTKNRILEFLQVEQVDDPPPFLSGKSYSDYFTKDERQIAFKAMQILASDETWQRIKHYFT